MDPNQLSVVLGLLTNGLYSLILCTSSEVMDHAFRQHDIYKCLMRNEDNFASIVERAFQGLPLVIKQEEYCEFLKSNESVEIVKRIYSFRLYDCNNLNNLEKVEADFCEQLALYFSGRQGIPTVAPYLFSILIECSLESLDIIIKEEQKLAALDHKNRYYIKLLDEKQSKYQERILKDQERILKEIEITQMLLKQFLETEPKNMVPHRQASHPINMAPDLENDFIQRDVEYKKLIGGILNNQNDTAIAITTTLRGAGGYGKTTLAKAICYDPKTQKEFTDGILWVTLGETPKNLIGHIQDLIYRLSSERPEFEGLDAAVSYFRDLLHGKRLLLVIDDVWNSAHLEPFMQGGSRCVRLITTRVNEVLPEGTIEVNVDAMEEEEAIKLLRSGLSYADDRTLDELTRRLGNWPLLLKMVNSALKQHVKRGKSFEDALDYVKYKLDKKKLTAFDPKKVQKRNQAVESTICISFDLLDEDEFERYKELAIFPEDEEISLKTVEKLWGKTADYGYFDVEDLCYKLFNLSLLHTYDENRKIIKLHDVMRDYLNSKQQKIYLIHSEFLESYAVKSWSDLPEEETYLWRYLSYHLVEAERKAELRKLLLDFNWMQFKLNATDAHSLLSDYDFFPGDYTIEMVKGAIRLSANALSKEKKMLAGQLLGRLQSFSHIEIDRILKQIWENKSEPRVLPLTGSLMSPGGSLIRTLIGHSGQINAVSIIAGGNYAISSSSDKTLKVWDFKTGKEIRTLTGHSNLVRAVSVTPDGSCAVSGSCDKTLKVWDIKTGKEVRTLTGHSDSVNAVSITPDGNYIVSASSDGTLKVWDIKTGKEVRTLTGHSNLVRAVTITPDGDYAVSSSDDKTLKVWDIKTGKEVCTLTGHSESVNSVSVTPDGNYAVSASGDKTLKMWDLRTEKEVRTLTGHSDAVNAISITSDGNFAVSASSDRNLKVWNLGTGKEVRTITGHSYSVNDVTVNRDYAVSASDDNTLKVWDIKEIKEMSVEDYFKQNVWDVPSLSDLLLSVDNTLKWGNIKEIKKISVENYFKQNVWDVPSLSNTQQRGYVPKYRLVRHILNVDINDASLTSSEKILKALEFKAKKKTLIPTGHSFSGRKISVYSDGNYAILASSEKTPKASEFEVEKKKHTPIGHSGSVRKISVSSDGNYAVSASSDRILKVWDIKTGQEICTLSAISYWTNTISVFLDRNCTVLAPSDSVSEVCGIKTRKEICTLTGQSYWVNSVSIPSNGNYAVSASDDNTLKVWDLKTRKKVRTLTGHSDLINAVSISPDGNYAVSASFDETLKVWNLRTGEEISAFNGESPFLSVVFSLDGTTIVAGEASGRVHFLRFEKGNEHYI